MSEISNNEKLGRVIVATATGIGSFTGITACNSKLQNPPAETQHVDQNDDLFKGDVEYDMEGDLTLEDFTIDAGKYGILKPEYNAYTGMYHISFSPEATEMLKQEGGEVEFVLPFESIVNISGGHFFVENENGEYEEWRKGNPAVSEDGEFVIEEERSFKGTWEKGNDSASFEITTSPTRSFDGFEYPEVARPNYQTEEDLIEFTPLDLETNLQQLGTYAWRPVYENGVIKGYILEIADKNLVKKGTQNLADLKIEGGRFATSFPWPTKINSVVGTIRINGIQVLNGNPIYDENGVIINKEYHIPADTLIEFDYAPDPSNGFSGWIDAESVE